MQIKAPGPPPPGLGLFSQLSVCPGSRRSCPHPRECSESPPKPWALFSPRNLPLPPSIHQLRPLRNVLPPGTARARSSELILGTFITQTPRQARGGFCPDLPIWPGRMGRWKGRRRPQGQDVPGDPARELCSRHLGKARCFQQSGHSGSPACLM